MSLDGNLTLQILHKAERDGYGILSQTWRVALLSRFFSPSEHQLSGDISLSYSYDANMAIGLVRAAERARSPAVLQLFPVTLEYGKGPFLRFCLDVFVSSAAVRPLRSADRNLFARILIQRAPSVGPYRSAPRPCH